MKIAYICCSYGLTIYAIQAATLRTFLQKNLNETIDVITSNCNCFYTNTSSAIKSLFNYKEFLNIKDSSFIMMPHFRLQEASTPGGFLRMAYRSFSEPARGYLYAKKTQNYDVVHFFQSSESFGYEALKHFLRFSTKGKKVITIYRLCSVQKENPSLNKIYNTADAVIVSTQFMKKTLCQSGVMENKIHVIPYGAHIQKNGGQQRSGAIMFSGSPLINVKGFEYLAPALKILKQEGHPIQLTMHGYYMKGHKEWAGEVAKKAGIEDLILMTKFDTEEALRHAYQRSMCSLIPYTDYPGDFPMVMAMSSGTPIIATNCMGMDEYINGAGISVEPHSVSALADALRKVISSNLLREQMSAQGKKIAETVFAWDVVAGKTLNVYTTLSNS